MNLSFACSGVTDLSHLDGYVWVHGAGKPKYFAHLCVRKDSGNLTDNGQVFDLQLAAVILSRL